MLLRSGLQKKSHGWTKCFSVQVENATSSVSGMMAGKMAHSQASLATQTQVSNLPNNLTVITSGRQMPAVGLILRIPAGSRYEQAWSNGLSHHLRHSFFAGNKGESSLALTRKMELRGANLMIENDRDSISIGVECPRETLEGAIQSMAFMIQRFGLESHQMEEVSQRVELDRQLAEADPCARLWAVAFELAYRNGLGNNPISCALTSKASPTNISRFFEESMKRTGHILSAVGIGHSDAIDLLKSHIHYHGFFDQHMKESPSQVKETAKYFGGERRIPMGGDQNYVFIGFGTLGLADLKERKVADVMASLIGGRSAVAYGNEMSHLPGIAQLLSASKDIKIHSINADYSNGGLLGIIVSAPNTIEMSPIIEVICKDLRGLTNSTSLSSDAFIAAKHRSASRLAAGCESRQVLAKMQYQSLLADCDPFDLQKEISLIADLELADFKTMASRILSKNPVFITMGDLCSLPYSDKVQF